MKFASGGARRRRHDRLLQRFSKHRSAPAIHGRGGRPIAFRRRSNVMQNVSVKRGEPRSDMVLPPTAHVAVPQSHGLSKTDTGRTALFAAWAVVPLVTLGLGSVATFAFAAIRLRSRSLGLCAAVYGSTAVAFLYLVNTGPDSSWQANLGVGIGLTFTAVATGHGFAIRQTVQDGPVITAEDEARGRLRRRSKARKLLTKNPPLAQELKIGRPDLSTNFDDGGLIDANHVPESYLTSLPGFDSELAHRVVELRESVGGFDSLDDMGVLLNLAPQRLDSARERLIFIR
jgi:DNA uptake protein ComE-like DNA-binding protein